MRRTLSLILSAAMLFAACLIPAEAATNSEIAGKFSPESVAAANAVKDAADFVIEYYDYGTKDDWQNWVIYLMESEYPDHILYLDPEKMMPHAEVPETLLKELFSELCTRAPVNFFDTAVVGDLSGKYDSNTGSYSLDPIGTESSYNVPEFIGYRLEGSKFTFYYSLREREYLDPALVPLDAVDTVEYGGKIYTYVGWEARYVWEGSISDKGTEIEFDLTDKGIVITAMGADVTIPMGLQKVADPDGDVNGDAKVNAKDVTTLMKFLVGSVPAVFSVYAADVRYDNILNARDVTTLMKRLVAKG